jgi:hypothetical protein
VEVELDLMEVEEVEQEDIELQVMVQHLYKDQH